MEELGLTCLLLEGDAGGKQEAVPVFTLKVLCRPMPIYAGPFEKPGKTAVFLRNSRVFVPSDQKAAREPLLLSYSGVCPSLGGARTIS